MTITVTFEREGLVELLQAFKGESVRQAPGVLQFRLKAFHDQEEIWEYEGSTGRIVPQEGKTFSHTVLDVLDMCGASELRTSFSGYREERELDSPNWGEWFLERVSLKYLIPDTNFIYRHYCSNVLARSLGADFKNLIFRLPRLVVLEIERRGNHAQEGSADKRLSFYAAREVNFLRSGINFDLLPSIDVSLFSTFTEKAGKKLTDMWIRKEIHDSMRTLGYTNTSPKDTILLTCDLMNALAGEAEGLSTCYFSRSEQQSYFIDSSNMQQLFDFILASAIMFEKIRVDVIIKGDAVHKSLILKGIWDGKTTSQWFSDTIIAAY